MPLPPEVDDAISPRSPLHPPRKSFAFALRTAAVPPGRCIGTRECSNVKPLRLRDTALATVDGVCSNSDAAHRYSFATHSFNGYRCCPIPTLYKVLLGRAFSLRSPLRARELLSSPSFPHCGALALFACGRADLSHRCSLATLTRSVRRRAFPAIGYGNTSCRSEHRNKRVSQCEASTSPRHRTRCAPTVSAPTPLLHTATALQHTLSTAIAVVRYLPLPKPHL